MKQTIQQHKPELLQVLWRLDGMRAWRLAPDAPVPIAKPGQRGGPGHCHSCGVSFDSPNTYGRCAFCWLAFDEWLEEQAQRAEGAVFEV